MLALYLALIDDEDDKKLFEEIYESYRKQMLAVAISILKNNEDAEDAVHDVFYRIAAKHIKVIRKIENIDGRRNYLLKAVKNTALNMLKKKSEDSLEALPETEWNPSGDFSDKEFLDMICNKMDYDRIMEEIRKLDDLYRDVLYYHFAAGLTAPEISDFFDRSLAAVKRQLVRGKKQLIHNIGLKKGDVKYGNEQGRIPEGI